MELLSVIIQIVHVVVVPLIGLVTWAIIGIKTDVASIRETLVSIETWRTAHDKQDDERHDTQEHERRSLWEAIRSRGGHVTLVIIVVMYLIAALAALAHGQVAV